MEKKAEIEQSLMIETVVSTEFLRGLREFWRQDLAGAGWRWVAEECLRYLDQYGEAPGRSIQPIWEAAQGTIDEEAREALGDMLARLSDEYEAKERPNPEFMLEKARKWFQREAGLHYTAEEEGAYDAWDLDRARQLEEEHRQYQERLEAPLSKIELLDMADDEEELEPTKWVVPGVIPVGLTIIAGEPKAGKSDLMLNICIDLVTREKILGTIEPPVEPMKVFYAALETSRKELRNKVSEIRAERSYPKGSFRAVPIGGLPTQDKGLMPLLKKLVDEHHFDIIIIDTAEMIRPEKERFRGNAYREDSQFFKPFHAFAHDNNLALVFTTHTTKEHHKSLIKNVTGSLGQAGKADEVMEMVESSKAENGRLLRCAGRELGRTEFLLSYDSITSWYRLVEGKDAVASAETDDPAMSLQRTAILEVLTEAGRAMKRKEILEDVGRLLGETPEELQSKGIDTLLKKLCKSGRLEKPGYNLYIHKEVRARQRAIKKCKDAREKIRTLET